MTTHLHLRRLTTHRILSTLSPMPDKKQRSMNNLDASLLVMKNYRIISPEAFWSSRGSTSNLRNIQCLLRVKLKEDCGKKAGATSVTYVNLHDFFSAPITSLLIAAPELSFYSLPDF